jgi:hypothetical protein
MYEALAMEDPRRS